MYSQRSLLSMIGALLIYFGASAHNDSAAGTRWGNGVVSLTAATYTAAQNAGYVTITVSRTGSGGASVSYATANITALAGTDYTSTQGSLSWGRRDSSPKSFVIPISNAAPFAGTKTFAVAIAGASGASLGSITSAIVTINGDAASAPAPSPPTISISASPTNVSSGNGSTLTWSSTNATSCSASGAWSGAEAVSGTYSTGALSTSATYALSCTGAGGTASQSATVTVAAIPPPTVSISANPTSVSSGSGSTLTWSSTNATSCTASGAWSGNKAASGTYGTGALSSSATYALTCTGAGGSASQSATVTVTASTPPPTGLSCTGTSGSLTLRASMVRDTGISPLLVFFDASGTTDSAITGNTTAFQDVTYTWNFGDTGASGTDTWAYGANPGKNSRNSATGGVAAHLYVTTGVDTAYVATVTAHSGSNTASCQLGVTAYDPARSNGFAGAKTTCVSASGTPTPGSGGCPAGAAVLSTSSFNTALGSSHFGSGKRVLFKCGDTFTGGNATLNATTWSVGAYGSCEGNQSGRPIFKNTGAAIYIANSTASGDGRVADIDFEGGGSGNAAVSTPGGYTIPYQITLSNLYSNGNNGAYSWAQCAQCGIIESVETSMHGGIGTFLNFNENNPTNWTGNKFNNVDYLALIGSLINGASGTTSGAGEEVVRISAGRLGVIENNTIENANNIGAVLKIHNGNTNNSTATWTGVYTELFEISDNWFGGTSGGQYVEVAAQNAGLDERLRNFVIERNLFSGTTGAQGGRQLMASAVNETVRDNVFYMPGNGTSTYAILGAQLAQRGTVQPPVTGGEAYNNTCYVPSGGAYQSCIGLDTTGSMGSPANNSYARNNLFYAAGTHTTVNNTGSGNIVSNNTTSTGASPGFINGSGAFKVISDFKPTANSSGAMTVPVWSDALGVLWSSSWNLGALHE